MIVDTTANMMKPVAFNLVDSSVMTSSEELDELSGENGSSMTALTVACSYIILFNYNNLND